MSALPIRHRAARRAMAVRRLDRHDERAADALMHASSSTPDLQRYGDSGRGIVLALIVGLAILGWAQAEGFG